MCSVVVDCRHCAAYRRNINSQPVSKIRQLHAHYFQSPVQMLSAHVYSWRFFFFLLVVSHYSVGYIIYTIWNERVFVLGSPPQNYTHFLLGTSLASNYDRWQQRNSKEKNEEYCSWLARMNHKIKCIYKLMLVLRDEKRQCEMIATKKR